MVAGPRTSARTRRAAVTISAIAVAISAAIGAGACSLVLDLDAAQCHSDADCARFAGASCDTTRRICRAIDPDAGSPSSGGDADAGVPMCSSPTGCSPCPLGVAPGLANACSNVACVPFDNTARLHNLTPDGAIKPLP